MATFPPKGASKNAPVPTTETPAVSTGKGGIPASLKIKAAGTKNAPGKEKTVNYF